VTRPIDILTRWRREGIVDVHVSTQDLKRWRREMEATIHADARKSLDEKKGSLGMRLGAIQPEHILLGPVGWKEFERRMGQHFDLSEPLGRGFHYYIVPWSWCPYPQPIIAGPGEDLSILTSSPP
jgi:hypothetical protein